MKLVANVLALVALASVSVVGCTSKSGSAPDRADGSANATDGGTQQELTKSLAAADGTPGGFSTRFADVVGPYVWGGTLNAGVSGGKPLAGTVDFVAQRGFRTTRIAITPYMKDATDYGMAFPQSPTKLVDLLSVPEVDETLRHPMFDVMTLTTFDFTSDFPVRNRFLERAFLSANEPAIFAEYVDFFEALQRKYNGTGKTFVITNWEGDNTIFCGDVAKYGTTDAGVRECEATLVDKDMNARVDAFTRWNLIRRAAVIAARARVAGASDVSLYFAIELNQIHQVNANNWRTTLSSVIPAVKPDLVLYSAYESTGANRLVPDLAFVRTFLNANGMSATRIGVGELGLTGSAVSQSRGIRQALRGAVSGMTDVALVYLWNAVNPTSCDPAHPDPSMSCWGLYQPDGTPFVAPYQGNLVSTLSASSPGRPDIDVNLSPTAGQSTLTIGGDFPGSADKTRLEVFIRCAGGSASGARYESLYLESASATSLTAKLPKHLEGSSCSLRVHSDWGIPSAWSSPFRTQ